MSRYAVITGDTDHTSYAEQLESMLNNGEVLTLSADELDDDSVYDDLTSCTAVLGLGELDDDQQDVLQTATKDAGVPVLSDQGYDGFQDVDYDDIMLDGLSAHLEQAQDYQKADRLKDSISSKDELGIVIHRDPDPDAIASAYALQQLSEHYNVSADIFYSGEITHQENRSLVNKIGIDMKELDDQDVVADYDGTALLDTGITNSGLADDPDADPAFQVDIVIDHHPGWDEYTDHVQDVLDVQRDRGSTASIVSDYYQLLGVEPDRDVATALLHGTRSDTHAFDPNKNTFTVDDLETETYLHRYADMSSLAEIVRSPMTEETADVISRAIDNRTSIGDTKLFSYVGDVDESDALPQAADFLSKIKGTETAVVAGVETSTEEDAHNIRVSARSRDIELDLGSELKDTLYSDPTLEQFDPPAGGTGERAGAYIPLLFDTDDMAITESDYDTLHRLRSTWLQELFTDLGKD